MRRRFYLGFDLGRMRDHSAIAVIELDRQGRKRMVVRSVKRIPLGTPYEEVLEILRRTVGLLQSLGTCRAVVDATGVGSAVVEMLKECGLGCETVAVTITGGDQPRQLGYQCGVLWWNVPKHELVGRVQVMLEKEELRIPRSLAEVGSVVRELKAMRVGVTDRRKGKMEARGKDHDDLIMAIALGCWQAGQPTIGLRDTAIF